MPALHLGFCHHLDGEGLAQEERLVVVVVEAVVTVKGLENPADVYKSSCDSKRTARVAILAGQIRNSPQRCHQSGRASDRKNSNAS